MPSGGADGDGARASDDDGPVDFTALRRAARANMAEGSWAYYEATAGASRRESRRDVRAWRDLDLVPRALIRRAAPDLTVALPNSVHRGGARLATPVVVAPTAAHGLAHPDGEHATARGAAAAGALMVYSNSATVPVAEFGAAAAGPWWAQLYLQRDRARSWGYLDRAASAGAGAVVLTVDLGTGAAEPSFRRTAQRTAPMVRGNYPDVDSGQVMAGYEETLTPDVIGEISSHSGLPVHVKGILHPADAARAVEAGAAGIIVSNHGRRQLGGVAPVARVLPGIVDAVAGRVPVIVDGGIRSGADVARALALGASLVGVGRPILWALAADGERGVTGVLTGLTAEVRQSMASLGAASLAELGPDHLLL